jgi:hypothetical protein
MSASALAIPASPAAWRRAASATDGCAITVDGREVLHIGARPVYRADVDTSLHAVSLVADDRAVNFGCQAAGDGGAPERPGPRFGWRASAPDGSAEVSVRVGHVLTVCLQDRDASRAVEQITRAVGADARQRATALRADAPSGPAGHAARTAADAWYMAGLRLVAGLDSAARLRRVPVRPLRDEFLRQVARGEITATALAARVGWRRRGGPGRRCHGDSARVLRRLGLSIDPADRRPTQRRRRATADERALLDDLDDVTATVSYDIAVALCRGMRRDPADFGWL